MGIILCAVELTETARPVMAVAAALARMQHKRLELLHVVYLAPGIPPEYLSERVIADLRKGAAEVMDARAAELRRMGVDAGSVVELDLVDDGILKTAEKRGADLLVLGTHARQGAARVFLGSVAERVIHAAPCPVIVVPPSAGGRLVKGEALASSLKVEAGIDLSPASDAALSWLRALDTHHPLDVRLVHLYWPPREHQRLGLEPPDPFEPDHEVTEVLTRELRGHVETHLGREDVSLRVRPYWGAEDNPLAWEAETDDADLLVVGTSQGRGSTALATVRSAHLPVACVPGRRPGAAPRRLSPVRTVFVTTDFSPLGNAAVGEAYRLLLRGGGNVVLFHVAEPGQFELDADRRSEIETCLLALVPTGMGAHAIRTRTAVVADRSPSEAIVKAIRRFQPDVVVMSSHGRKGLGRAIRGSVTEHVVRTSPTPVLVVPATAEAIVQAAEDPL